MKTRRAGSMFAWCRFHQARRRAISGRLRSAAKTVFLKLMPALAPQEAPEHIAGHHDPAVGELGQERVEREIGFLAQPPRQCRS
jgi:hypothetical protein